MAVTIETRGTALVAVASGRIDSANASQFQEELSVVNDGSGSGVILDLGGLSYISSAGLRVILMVAKTLRSTNTNFVVCSPSDAIREIFEISGFSQIIPIHNSQDEALSVVNN